MNSTPQTQNTGIRHVLPIASIYAFRMLGLFMVLPVFSVYAKQLTGSTPLLIGLALGGYGFSQALLQIPFGMLSDKYGRKLIITVGLILFIIGSIIAAFSHSIYGVIVGRIMQGAGAIGSTLSALVADVTTDEKRTQAMATIGMVIGISFSIAMVAGPLINHFLGLNGIFAITAALGVCGLLILHTLVPKPQQHMFHADSGTSPALLGKVLTDKQLLSLDASIFFQHAILTASFIALPMILINQLQLTSAHLWMLYLPILAVSFILMVPCVIIAEKMRHMKLIFCVSIALLAISQLLLSFLNTSWMAVIAMLTVFFTAFNALEAILPSWVSKQAPAGSKGTAMGVYSSSQFFGIFFGGAIGGLLLRSHSVHAIFLGCGILAILWLALALTMREPLYLSTQLLPISKLVADNADQIREQLRNLPGVCDVMLALDEKVAYLKVDKTLFKPDDLRPFQSA